jgi:ABC-2 type transport system permease protein
MLWYKAWLETRWRFLIGLALLLCSAAAIVLTYPTLMKLLPTLPAMDDGTVIGRRIREAADLSRSYRGYVWSQGFRQNLAELVTLFAVLLGTGGLLTNAAGGASLFTLSMPVSRPRLLGIRAAASLVELLTLAVIPALAIPLLSPSIGESYGVGSTLVHAVCLFFAAAVFFSLAFLLSIVFDDVWRPLVITLAIAIVLGLAEHVFPWLARDGVFGVMSGETYFRTGAVPWAGLLTTAAVSIAMMYAASAIFARRDF